MNVGGPRPLAPAAAAPAGPPAVEHRSGRVERVVDDLWRARELLRQLVVRDIRIRYKQAAMGFAWAVLTPCLVVTAGILVRYAMAYVGSEPLAMGDLAGISVKALFWSFFVGAVGFATGSLTSNFELVTKVEFPRVVLPLSATLAQAFDTMVGAVAVALLLPFLGVGVHLSLLWVPLLALLCFGITAAVCIFLACANLFFRDVKYIVQVMITFGIFFTPVFFEPEMFGELGSLLLMLNPLSPLLEGLRLSVVEGVHLSQTLVVDSEAGRQLVWSPWYLAYSAAWVVLGLLGSVLMFTRLEHLFAEYV